MTWVKRIDSDFFYGGLILLFGISYVPLKVFYFDYRLISFGIVMGLFIAFLFEKFNIKWEKVSLK